uniref:Na+/proline symporter n=1 Tax=Candidatus Kentrum sp. LPFa TaxID=2126335 RepID=A0A450VNF1_9GAMM|nr:MAG: Na+/proline symporter [Candidatus Kentron sp. LPFa]VFK23483.1 MAG: Na+/proline symporter [Candidatus Kentron sp. LPFa]
MTLPALLMIFFFLALITYSLRRVFVAGSTLTDVTDYLYAGSSLPKKDLWRTAIASNFQAASNLFIGIQLGYLYGANLVITAFAYTGGFWLLKRLVVSQTDEQLATVFQRNELPYDRLLPVLTPKWRMVLNFFIYASILFVAVLEVWLAVKFIGEVSAPVLGVDASMATSIFPAMIVAIVVVAALFFYVYVGGYRAIVATDEYQLNLISIMLIFLIGGCGLAIFPLIGEGSAFHGNSFVYGSGNSGFSILGLGLALGFSFLNLFWPLLNPQQWQRAQAANNAKEYLSSLRPTMIGIGISWSIPVLVGALLAGFISDIDVSLIAVYPFQEWLKVDESGFVAPIILAFCAAGILAAALSTSDTVVMAFIAYILGGDRKEILLGDARQKSVGVTVIIFIAALVIYVRDPSIEQFLFAVFTALVIFAPAFVHYVYSGGSTAFSRPLPSKILIGFFVASYLFVVWVNLFASGPIAEYAYYLPFPIFVLGLILVVGVKRMDMQGT